MAADLKVTVTVELAGEVIATGTNAGYPSSHTAHDLLPGAMRDAISKATVKSERDAALRRYRVLYGDA